MSLFPRVLLSRGVNLSHVQLCGFYHEGLSGGFDDWPGFYEPNESLLFAAALLIKNQARNSFRIVSREICMCGVHTLISLDDGVFTIDPFRFLPQDAFLPFRFTRIFALQYSFYSMDALG